mgnify:CR=1 FL=1
MKQIPFTNVAIFALFFGIALLEALQSFELRNSL